MISTTLHQTRVGALDAALHAPPCPRVRAVVLACVAAVVGNVAALVTTPATAAAQDNGSYAGREIANVMSFRGARWLEREARVAEENPDALHALLPIEPGDTVVDLGCGSGFHARRLAGAVGDTGLVLCVDLQPEMLDIARYLAEREGIDNLSLVRSTEADPKLPDGEIDLILMVDVYHEFSQPAAMLEEMRAALAPDGVIALVEFRLEGETARHIKLEHRMSIAQVMNEWRPPLYGLIERIDSPPTQHLFLFGKAEQ